MIDTGGYEKCFGVLTGDLVRSTRLPVEDLERMRAALPEILLTFERQFPGSVRGQAEFFRGDSWQVLMQRPERSLRMAMVITAWWKSRFGTDTRLAIGLGAVTHVVEDKISLSAGEAFVLSGRALDGMTGFFNVTGVLPGHVGALTDWLPLTLHLCGQFARGWTRRQAEIVTSMLLDPDGNVETTANALTPSISRQAAYKSLQAANWRAVADTIKVFEATDWDAVINRRTAGSG